MDEYRRVSSGSPFEPVIGLSRAVRSGAWIAVAGTAPLGPDGKTVHAGNVYEQTRRCLEIIAAAIAEAGGSVGDVIRTRILLKDIGNWQEAARAHGEVFADIRPANTIMQVVRFIDPEWQVEVEADCFVRPA